MLKGYIARESLATPVFPGAQYEAFIQIRYGIFVEKILGEQTQAKIVLLNCRYS